ncbi:hypothetical protein JCM10908_003932 [Rhodotorula pacifica]|uniref:acyl-CoA thioesterase n=1 Tax=Rhodotorula pacifica TaxID=1495444 RepID=UPI003178FBDA
MTTSTPAPALAAAVTTGNSAQSRSVATTAAPIGNPLAAEKYSSGKEAAMKWAKENGYSEECLVELPVQWGEQDANAHVNNAVYFRWLETGRLNFMRVLGSHLQNEQAAKDLSGSGKGKGVILARITFDYRRPVMQPDNVLIAHKPLEVAARKLVLHGSVYSYSQQAVVGESDSVMVAYDYDATKSCEWDPELIRLLVERGAEHKQKGGEAKL